MTDEQVRAFRKFSKMWGRYWKSHLIDDYHHRMKFIGSDIIYTVLDDKGPGFVYSKELRAAIQPPRSACLHKSKQKETPNARNR